MKTLTKTQWWLKMHQVIAFWHGFGISNGLEIPKDKVKEIYTNTSGRYVSAPVRGGKVYIKINKQYMMNLLKEYIKWLISYKDNWTKDTFDDTKISDEKQFLGHIIENPGQVEVYKMIKLLQDDEQIEDYNSLLKEIEEVEGQQQHLKE